MLVLGATGLAAVLVALAVLGRVPYQEPVSTVTTVTPALPPAGGFAVAADQMDETLRTLVGSGWTPLDHVALGGEQSSVDSRADVTRVVRGGAVLVDTPRGPGLLQLDVRRSAGSCAATPCRRTTRLSGTSTTPPSVEVVVDQDGVEVRARAWAGPRAEGRATLDLPPLPVEALLQLAGDRAWRDRLPGLN